MRPAEKVEGCLRQMIEQENRMVGASVLVLHRGQEALYAQAGMADREKRIPMHRDAIFRMYSQTKPVTAAAAALLVERGQIDLMEPVSSFFPSFRHQQVMTEGGLVPAKRPVVIMDLLGMSAGLTYGGEDAAGEGIRRIFEEMNQRRDTANPMTTLAFAERVGELPLAFQPGERFRYSLCADVLAAVVEKVDGRPFSRFLREEFFEPLGMQDTGFYVPPEKQHRLTACYERTARGLERCSPTNAGIRDETSEPAFASGGGGLNSTVDDYAAFAQMLLNEGEWQGKRILSPESVRFLTSRQLPYDEPHAIWHGLEGFGYGKLMRQAECPGEFPGFARRGEYGWDGWLGVYFENFPVEQMTILMMMAVKDTGASAMQRRVRNVVLAMESMNEI